MSSLATSLVDPIREGSFPESASVLSADLDPDTIPELLSSITKARDELSAELRNVSKPYAGGVDKWIAQAKKVQEDIARCKQDAQDIVQEHTRLEKSRAESSEAQRRSRLLSDEIAFTEELQSQLHSVSDVHQKLQSIEASLSNDDIVEAAKFIEDIAPRVANLSGPRLKSVVSEYKHDLLIKTKAKLENALMSRVTVRYDGTEALLAVQDSDTSGLTNASLTIALSGLESLDSALDGVVDKIETFVLRILSVKTSRHLLSHEIKDNSFTISLGEESTPLPQVLSFSRDAVSFLHATLPEQIYSKVTTVLGPRFISSLITDWLTPAIPLDLSEVHTLDLLSAEVSGLAEFMDTHQWPNAGDLKQWTQHAPRMWITKRKSEALDAVRNAFALSRGSLHQVERVERQKISPAKAPQEQESTTGEDPADDWNISWDDDEKPESTSTRPAEAEDDTSGWGFDDDVEDDQHKDAATNGHGANDEEPDDTGEAWGWGDDDAEEAKPVDTAVSQSQAVNGEQNNVVASQLSETTELTEYYSITDIPDHLIEVIGKDIQDALSLQEESHTSLQGVPASSGLLALPALSLAMFRATAPTYYSKNPELGNMNLYNDATYIADKLRHMSKPAGMKDMETDCQAMDKFARSAYAREMDTQRTILGDLLDGVQGFTIPYAEQIEDAIAATGERLRQVHAEWTPILSTSALLQSTGALLSSILSKVITDIEEMDDISEAQSQRLGNFCGQLAKLEDLFIARPPGEDSAGPDEISMVAVYCSNWLRFQYLINILESNLQDIKYLWTEGELSLEFSQEEVVDLIKALFADSSHRKGAISAIRGNRRSGV